MTFSLTLGDLELMDDEGLQYGARVMAGGFSRGAPVPIDVAVKSWLQDGSIVVTQGYDNREVMIRVRFSCVNLTELAEAEAALFAELGKPNLLTWTPPDGYGAACVFVVITSSMEQDDQSDAADFLESEYSIRTYDVRLTCEAFTRSATETVTAALPATGSTTTLLDACSATTGWTGSVDGGAVSPATAGGAVTLTATLTVSPFENHTIALQKTFAAMTTSTKFLTIDWKPPAGWDQGVLTALGDGVTLPLVSEGPSPTSGYTRSLFQVAASSLAVTRLTVSGKPTSAVPAVFSIDNVAVSDVNPTLGTARQQIRSLTVSGSAPTPGSLAVESATAALGTDTTVYVYPRDASTSGYSPPMRQFRYSGNAVTPDAAQVSGSTEPLDGAPVRFAVPIGLFPRGSYLLMARLATSGGGTPTISWDTYTSLGGVTIDLTPIQTRQVTTTTAYQTFALGKLQLPSRDLDPASATAGAQMWLDMIASAACTYDEVWLFNTTIGSVIQVDCGTGAGTVGGNSRRLFIEPPTVTTPRPTVRIGHSADRSDSRYPVRFPAWQFPEFEPPQVNVFTVTPNATDSTVTLRHFPRWHTNPAS